MSVPGGTAMTTSSAFLPWQLSGMPRPPSGARQCLRLTMSARLSVPATARMMTLPPSPPSPPSGPPRGTYFSRRKLHRPRPPSPPLTKISTRSTNMVLLLGVCLSLYDRQEYCYQARRRVFEPAGLASCVSVSVAINEAVPDGHPQDAQVEPGRPMRNV